MKNILVTNLVSEKNQDGGNVLIHSDCLDSNLVVAWFNLEGWSYDDVTEVSQEDMEFFIIDERITLMEENVSPKKLEEVKAKAKELAG